MSQSRYLHKKQAGLSLLEVLVATLVLSAGLLGLASLQIAGMKTTHNSYQIQQASWMVFDLLERMRANRAEVLRKDNNGSAISQYLINSDARGYCTSEANTSAVDCSSTQCTGQQTANYDLARLMCGYGEGSGVNNVLLNGHLQTSCPSGDCGDGLRLSLQWDERNSAANADDNNGNVRVSDFDGNNDGIESFSINLTVNL